MRILSSTLIGLALGLALPDSAAAACRESRDISRSYDTAAINSLALIARAGSLEINGTEREGVRLQARFCSDEAAALGRMEITDAVTDGVLQIAVRVPWDAPGFNPDYAHIDLSLEVPRDLLLDIKDSSGDIRIEQARVAALQDSSGDIRLIGGRGDLQIKDSSGDIEISGNSGQLTVTDSSGDLIYRDLGGDLTILSDSSGKISARGVRGSVTINNDSSGEIELLEVRDHVDIGNDSSGDIIISEVGGNVRIGSDGSGDIEASDVGGNFTVEQKSRGRIDSTRIAGEVSVP